MLYVRSLPTIAAVLALAAAATAQVGTNYTFSQSVGVYTPITGGTLLGTATTTTTLDDVTFAGVTLPFTFTYDGAPQTQVSIQTNGHLCFGATSPGTTYTPLSSAAVTPGFVSACGRDIMGGYQFASTRTLGSDQVTAISSLGPIQVGDVLTGTGIPTAPPTTVLAITAGVITMSALATATSAGTATQAYGPWSELRYETLGTTPNQEFVVQWSNFRRFSSALTTSNGTIFNFQIRLKENGEINCVYGNCTPGIGTTTTALHHVGLRGPTNAFPGNINNRMNTKGVNDDWSLSAAGTSNAVGMLFNNTAPANVIPNGLTYSWTVPPGTVWGTNATIGQGCVRRFTSFYELFGVPASFDLAGNALTMTPAGGGYSVTPGGTFMPVGSVQPVPTALALGDDTGIAQPFTVASFPGPNGPWTGVYVISNGCVSDIAGNTTVAAPVATTMLAAPRPGFYTQGDWDPVGGTGAGTIWFEESASVVSVTWDNVQSWNNPGSVNTFQIQLHSSGTVVIAWVAMAAVGSNGGVLVAYSPGGPSADPGSTDLSATLYPAGNIVLTATDVLPLTLVASNRPIQGAAPTNWNLTVSNVPATPVIGVDIFGLSDPGILDLSLFGFGKSGCQLRANLDIINAWLSAGTTHNYSLVIPPSPNLVNFVLYTQAAVLGAVMPDNITTNGIRGSIGNL